MKLDNESTIILNEATQLRNLLAQPGWSIVEREYDKIISEISDIRTLQEKLTSEEKVKAIEIRQSGLELFELLFRKIKGNSEIKERKKELNDLIKYHKSKK